MPDDGNFVVPSKRPTRRPILSVMPARKFMTFSVRSFTAPPQSRPRTAVGQEAMGVLTAHTYPEVRYFDARFFNFIWIAQPCNAMSAARSVCATHIPAFVWSICTDCRAIEKSAVVAIASHLAIDRFCALPQAFAG